MDFDLLQSCWKGALTEYPHFRSQGIDGNSRTKFGLCVFLNQKTDKPCNFLGFLIQDTDVFVRFDVSVSATGGL